MDSFFKNVKDENYLLNQKNKNKNVRINIVLAAYCRAGKTAFVLRFQNKNYNNYMKQDNQLLPTIVYDYFSLILNHKYIIVEIRIFDTIRFNSHRFNSLFRLFEKADIVFLFYDSSYKYSFESIKDKQYFFAQHCKKNTIFALIRNKYDIKKEEISDEEALEYADLNNMLFFHLSLHEKNETGIKELFEKVLNEYFKRRKEEKKKYEHFYYNYFKYLTIFQFTLLYLLCFPLDNVR